MIHIVLLCPSIRKREDVPSENGWPSPFSMASRDFIIRNSSTERRKGESLISSSESFSALSPDDTHASVSNVHPRQNRKKIERDVIEFSECAHCSWTFDPPSGSSTFCVPASSCWAEFPREPSWML